MVEPAAAEAGEIAIPGMKASAIRVGSSPSGGPSLAGEPMLVVEDDALDVLEGLGSSSRAGSRRTSAREESRCRSR